MEMEEDLLKYGNRVILKQIYFRRSTKEIETRKSTGRADVFENFLKREVFSDKSYVQRNIEVETVKQAGKRLNYKSEARVITLD